MFKELILMAYGVKSEDGRRFIKTDQLREEFSQTEAFNVLFMELATNDDAAVIFMDGILPRDMRGSITKEQIQANVKEVAGEPKRDAVGVPPVPPTR
jgi:type I restriction-modification system DNA methylase subunit